jgi:hypothetical protein
MSEYSVELWEPDGAEPLGRIPFDDFPTCYAYVAQFMRQGTGDVLRIRLPANTPDKERQILTKLGAELL